MNHIEAVFVCAMASCVIVGSLAGIAALLKFLIG